MEMLLSVYFKNSLRKNEIFFLVFQFMEGTLKVGKGIGFNTSELEWFNCRQCIEYARTRIFVWSVSCGFYLLYISKN